MNNNDILRIAMEQSAIDMNCNVEDFRKSGSTVVESNLNIRAKKCYKKKIFCAFAYYGDGLVASVDKEIKPIVDKYFQKNPEYRAFNTPQLIVLNKELDASGKMVCFLAEFFLPDLEKKVVINEEITIEILEEKEIDKLYEDDRFQMALGYGKDKDIKDMIAVVGYIDGNIAGIAGARDDSETMWQIGIEVLPEYRRNGVATTLTKILTDEIVKKGKVPYYCTAWSNIASKSNAINCGYKTAWVEMAAIDKSDALKMIEEKGL